MWCLPGNAGYGRVELGCKLCAQSVGMQAMRTKCWDASYAHKVLGCKLCAQTVGMQAMRTKCCDAGYAHKVLIACIPAPHDHNHHFQANTTCSPKHSRSFSPDDGHNDDRNILRLNKRQ
jgi:hypothetical protein